MGFSLWSKNRRTSPKTNVIDELRSDLQHIQENTSTAKELNILAVAFRTLDSLETYQQQLIDNILKDEPVEKTNTS